MAAPQSKAELLALIKREEETWEELIAAAGTARLTEPGVEGPWSIKDIIAHVTAWRGRGIARLEAARTGEPVAPAPWAADLPSTGDIFEAENQWIYQQNKDRSLDDILQEARASLQQLTAGITALPETTLTDPHAFPWTNGTPLLTILAGDSPDHFFDDHVPPIRAWIQA